MYHILLNDHYAVEQFASIELDGSLLQEIRVIHSDGSISEIDLNKAISEFSYFQYKKRKTNAYIMDIKKIAIPNLSPGDILEFDNY